MLNADLVLKERPGRGRDRALRFTSPERLADEILVRKLPDHDMPRRCEKHVSNEIPPIFLIIQHSVFSGSEAEIAVSPIRSCHLDISSLWLPIPLRLPPPLLTLLPHLLHLRLDIHILFLHIPALIR